jgi:uncharacterized protein (DUF58 family)
MWFRRESERTIAAAGVGAPAPTDVLDQVRRLELRMQRLVNTTFAGEYRSVYKGQGMEFAEVREYQPGDEVRRIDWNVTARTRKPFVKLYVEERELTVQLLIDGSASSRFGTRRRFKADVALEVAGVLALSALRNNDRVAMAVCTERVEYALPPAKGRRQGQRLLRDLLMLAPTGVRSDFGVMASHARQHLEHRSLVFVISDCRAGAMESALRGLAAAHEVVVITVDDPAESALPDIGLVLLQDPVTRATYEVDTGDAAFRARFAAQAAADTTDRSAMLLRAGVQTIALQTDADIVQPLLAFFRAKRGVRRASA